MENKTEVKKQLTWKAKEFKEHSKSIYWHVSYFLFSLLLLSYAIYSKSILTIITFTLLIIVGWFFSIKKPEIVEYSIDQNGIHVGNLTYPYKVIKTFWIIYNPPIAKTLNFDTTAYLNNQISLELGSQDPVAVRTMLKNYLTEDLDKEESLTEIVSRRLKF